MSLDQSSLIVLVIALAIGLLLGIKVTVFFSSMLRSNSSNRYYSPERSWDHPRQHHRDHRDQNSEGSLFGFFMLLAICMGLFLVARSTYSKLNDNNYEVTDRLITEKSISKQNTSSDESLDEADTPKKSKEYTVKPKTSSIDEITTSSPETLDENREKFVLKVGAFKHLDGAERKVKELQNQAIRAQYTTKTVNGNELYVVFAGPYSSKKGAEAVKQEISDNQAIVTAYLP